MAFVTFALITILAIFVVNLSAQKATPKVYEGILPPTKKISSCHSDAKNLYKPCETTLSYPKYHGSHQNFQSTLINGTHLRISLYKLSPWVTTLQNGLVSGSAVFFVRTAAKQYNFNYTLSPGKKSLSKLDNGTWTGVIQDLLENRTDMLLYIAHTYDRHQVLKFTTGIAVANLNFYTGKTPASVDWRALMYPLTPDVWVLLSLVSLTSICVLFLQLQFNDQHTFGDNQVGEHLYNAVATSFGSLLQESVKIHAKIRSLTVGLIFYSLVITTCYSSNLVSYLTYPEQDRVPSNYQELSESNQYNISMMEIQGGTGMLFMKKTILPTFAKIRERIMWESNLVLCMEKVLLQRRHVCISWDFIAKGLRAQRFSLNNDWDPLITSTDSAVNVPVNVVLPPASPYLDFWNTIVGRVKAAGLFEKWEEDALQELKQNRPPVDTKILRRLILVSDSLSPSFIQALRMHNLVLCFMSFMAGLVLSFVSFICEVLLGNLKPIRLSDESMDRCRGVPLSARRPFHNTRIQVCHLVKAKLLEVRPVRKTSNTSSLYE